MFYYLVGKSGPISKTFRQYLLKASIPHTITDSNSINALKAEKPTTVVYLSHKPRHTTKSNLEYIVSNIYQILSIFSNKKYKKSKIIYVSTSYVFSNNQSSKSETDFALPQSIYGLCKMLCEFAFRLLVYCGFISSCSIVRITKVVESLYPLFTSIETSIHAQKKFCIYDDSIYPVSAAYVSNLLLLIGNSVTSKFQVFHICGKNKVSYVDLAKELQLSNEVYSKEEWSKYFLLSHRTLKGSPYLDQANSFKVYKVTAKSIVDSYILNANGG